MRRRRKGKWAEGVCVSDRECKRRGDRKKEKKKMVIKFSAKICGLAGNRAEIDKEETSRARGRRRKRIIVRNETAREA